MTLTLQIPAELEMALRERAMATSKSPEELAVEALKDSLAEEPLDPAIYPIDAWLAEFRVFTSASPRGDIHANISREGIYEGRGE